MGSVRLPWPAKDSTAFLLCDVQERFRTVLNSPESVIKTASKMVIYQYHFMCL